MSMSHADLDNSSMISADFMAGPSQTEDVDLSLSQIGRYSSYLKAIADEDSVTTLCIPATDEPSNEQSCSPAVIDVMSSSEAVEPTVSVKASHKKIHRRKSYRIATVFKPAVSEFPNTVVPSEYPRTRISSSCLLSEDTSLDASHDMSKLDVIIPAPDSPWEKTASSTVTYAGGRPMDMEGYLNFKTSHIEGRRVTDRTWRILYVVLHQFELHLFTDRQDNSIACEAPIPVRSCLVDIVYEYSDKKKCFSTDDNKTVSLSV
jgi:hypothetical protein